jgi:heme-degrading monooxygenase HmoA
MIAQVFTLQEPPSGGAPELGAVAQAAMKETREAKGCEGLYVLNSRDGSGGIAVVLWRDEGALNAMRQREVEHIDEIRQEVPNLPEVPQPKLYDVTTA